MTDINISNQVGYPVMVLHLLEREDLESFKTRQLIDMLRYEKIQYGGDYDFCDQVYDNGYNTLQYRMTEYGQYTREEVQQYSDYVEVKNYQESSALLEFTYADRNQLKEILKSRPHIPNKMERKNLTRMEIQKSKGKTKRNLKYKR